MRDKAKISKENEKEKLKNLCKDQNSEMLRY